jgi:hypothetical protein
MSRTRVCARTALIVATTIVAAIATTGASASAAPTPAPLSAAFAGLDVATVRLAPRSAWTGNRASVTRVRRNMELDASACFVYDSLYDDDEGRWGVPTASEWATNMVVDEVERVVFYPEQRLYETGKVAIVALNDGDLAASGLTLACYER